MFCLQYSTEVSSQLLELTFKMKKASTNNLFPKFSENFETGKI